MNGHPLCHLRVPAPAAVAVCGLSVLVACVPSQPTEDNLRIVSFVVDQWKLAVSALGFAGTLITLMFALRQYRRAEQWKRAEFLAREAKEFFGDPKVRMALMLSDWGQRRVKLGKIADATDETLTYVTRELQVRALLPHTIVGSMSESDLEGESSDQEVTGAFTREHAIVRDCYDAYLDGLERFGSYLSTRLVNAQDLRPYLGYWIDDLAAPTSDPKDAAWAACVITYVHFYGYTGVEHLFREFGHDIGRTSRVYLNFTRLMENEELATKLRGSISPEFGAGDVTRAADEGTRWPIRGPS